MRCFPLLLFSRFAAQCIALRRQVSFLAEFLDIELLKLSVHFLDESSFDLSLYQVVE